MEIKLAKRSMRLLVRIESERKARDEAAFELSVREEGFVLSGGI